eukprot:CAMPEP_0168466740 /NCGR_PEP_ID=MMETSP0228-20121227/56818_1 /TAXON_ID=133427 /ORGANISM="Protoceratium reticulatum, Strain CCCM 535 (=CCMP 1889)" /LENGTH=41 /DNA_ID= /DNA_START= /DNA_END= /DNA_ORIENTATION=
MPGWSGGAQHPPEQWRGRGWQPRGRRRDVAGGSGMSSVHAE